MVSEYEQSPTDYKKQLGEALQRLRIQAGANRTDVAEQLECSEDKVGTIERGEVSMRSTELRALLDYFTVHGDDRTDLEHLAAEARKRRPRTPWGSAIPERLRKFFNTEETARVIESYLPELVHGLAQTEDYARALIGNNSSLRPDEVDRLVQARLARQVRLISRNPPVLTLIIPEAVLRVPIGGRGVMSAQLRHLRELSERPHVTIRGIPMAAGGHAGSGAGPFTILTPAGARRKTVYVETLTDGLFVDEESRVARYESVFKKLLSVALSPEETLTWLDTVSRQL